MSRLLADHPREDAPAVEDADVAVAPSTSTWSRRRVVLAALGVVLLGAALVAFFYDLSWHAFVGNSDDANAVLAGHAVAHGNVLLRGWTLASDTYWPVDIGFYGAYELFGGPGAAALHAVPAFLFAAVTLVATALAWVAGRGPSRIVGGATTLAILALPVPLGGLILLQGQQHVGTVLLCLVAFALLDSTWSTPRWWVGAAVLAAAALGDPLSYTFGVAAVAAAGVVTAIRRRDVKAMGPPVSAAAFALVTAIGGHHVLWHLGQHISPHPNSAPARMFATNAASVPRFLSNFLGAGSRSGVSRPVQLVHTVGLAAVTAGVLAALISIVGSLRPSQRAHAVRKSDSRWLDDVLVLGFWGSIGAFVITTTDHHDLATLRFLLPAVVFGATLAGRFLSRWRLPTFRLSVPVAYCSVALLAVAYVFGPLAMLRRPVTPRSPLTAWLTAHHLSLGIGPYWDASFFTVDSGNRIRIRTVIQFGSGLHALDFYADHKWFTGPDARSNPSATFLVYEPAAPWGGVGDETARATFGPPARIVDLGQFRILIWNGNILTRLPT